MTLRQFIKNAPGNFRRFWREINELPPHDYQTVVVCALGATLITLVLVTLHGILTVQWD